MPLPNLIPAGGQVQVQNTTFSVDALGRFVCSTWEEATANGGAPFSAIVVGAGMYGAYCAAKIFAGTRASVCCCSTRDAFLCPKHVQNLARIGLNVPSPILRRNDPGVARELVWGIPWRGNVEFPGLAYCTGGKSIYWGGWCPRLTAARSAGLARIDAAQYLDANYHQCGERDRRRTGHRIHLRRFVQCAARTSRGRRRIAAEHRNGVGNNGVEPAPLAVQGSAPARASSASTSSAACRS